MSKVRDPVCGMMVDPDSAAPSITWESREFFFCSEDCHRAFRDDPEAFASKSEEDAPYTTKGFTAPKFGSAGSGGLEHEPAGKRSTASDGQPRRT